MYHIDRNAICNLTTIPPLYYGSEYRQKFTEMTWMVLVRKLLKFYVCFGYQFSESYIVGWPVHFSYKFSNDFILNWTEHRRSVVLATCSMSQSSSGDHLSPSLAHRLPKPMNLAFFKGTRECKLHKNRRSFYFGSFIILNDKNHGISGHELGKTLGDSEGQGGLAWCSL